MTAQFADLETCAKVPGAPGTTQLQVRQPESHKGMQGATCCPPRRRTPTAMSVLAEKERARNWEEHKQQSNWAQGRPTHGSETSPNRTHNNTQGNHQVRALQQPQNVAHAERAISKHPPPPPSLYKVPTYSTRAGAAPRAPGGARHGVGNKAVTSQPRTGQSTSYGDVKPSYRGAGGWDRRGCTTWAPRSASRQGEEQHKHTERGSHTRRDKGEHSKQGGGAQQGRRGNQNSGNRKPEWSGWQSVRMGGSDNKGDGLASQPRRYWVPGQPLLNRHQVGGVSRSPDGLFAQQEQEPIRGRPAVRGKRTDGGQPGQHVEEQGTWASHTQKHSEEGYGRPVDRGAWTAKTVKRPWQQPAHPQYANYWAPLMRSHIQHSPNTPTTGLRERRNDTSKSTGRSGRQKAATRHNMRREERVTVQGPVKEQQPDGMSYRGSWRGPPSEPPHPPPPQRSIFQKPRAHRSAGCPYCTAVICVAYASVHRIPCASAGRQKLDSESGKRRLRHQLLGGLWGCHDAADLHGQPVCLSISCRALCSGVCAQTVPPSHGKGWYPSSGHGGAGRGRIGGGIRRNETARLGTAPDEKFFRRGFRVILPP